jgi:hypothetical protein
MPQIPHQKHKPSYPACGGQRLLFRGTTWLIFATRLDPAWCCSLPRISMLECLSSAIHGRHLHRRGTASISLFFHVSFHGLSCLTRVVAYHLGSFCQVHVARLHYVYVRIFLLSFTSRHLNSTPHRSHLLTSPPHPTWRKYGADIDII